MDLLLALMSGLPSDPLPGCSSSTKLIPLKNNSWIIPILIDSVLLVAIGQISNSGVVERYITPTSALAQFTVEIQLVYPGTDLDVQIADPTKSLCGNCDA